MSSRYNAVMLEKRWTMHLHCNLQITGSTVAMFVTKHTEESGSSYFQQLCFTTSQMYRMWSNLKATDCDKNTFPPPATRCLCNTINRKNINRGFPLTISSRSHHMVIIGFVFSFFLFFLRVKLLFIYLQNTAVKSVYTNIFLWAISQ